MLFNCEKCSCQLLNDLAISQLTLSHHMKTLNEFGAINSRKDGKRIYYSINKQGYLNSYNFFTKIMNSSLEKNRIKIYM